VVATLHLSALLLYAAAGTVFAASLARGRRVAPAVGSAFLWVGAATHAAGLAFFTVRFGDLPLVGLGPSFSSLAFLTALAAVVAGALKEVRPLALVLVPFVVLLTGAALLLDVAPTGEALDFGGVWFRLHVVPSFLAFAALSLAFAAGLLYLLQFRELKGKHFGRMFRFFPSLETLDRVSRYAVVAGFVALTLGLLTGTAWIARFREADDMGIKVAWGGLTWLVFLTALLIRRRGVNGERQAAMVTVVGFVVVVVAYVLFRLSVPSGGLFL